MASSLKRRAAQETVAGQPLRHSFGSVAAPDVSGSARGRIFRLASRQTSCGRQRGVLAERPPGPRFDRHDYHRTVEDLAFVLPVLAAEQSPVLQMLLA